MVLRFLFLGLFFISSAFAQKVSIFINGQPGSKNSILKKGDTVTIRVDSSDSKGRTVYYSIREQSQQDSFESQNVKSFKVSGFHERAGVVTYVIKIDNRDGYSNDTISHDGFDFFRFSVAGPEGSSVAKIEKLNAYHNGTLLEGRREATLKVGDKIVIEAIAKDSGGKPLLYKFKKGLTQTNFIPQNKVEFTITNEDLYNDGIIYDVTIDNQDGYSNSQYSKNRDDFDYLVVRPKRPAEKSVAKINSIELFVNNVLVQEGHALQNGDVLRLKVNATDSAGKTLYYKFAGPGEYTRQFSTNNEATFNIGPQHTQKAENLFSVKLINNDGYPRHFHYSLEQDDWEGVTLKSVRAKDTSIAKIEALKVDVARVGQNRTPVLSQSNCRPPSRGLNKIQNFSNQVNKAVSLPTSFVGNDGITYYLGPNNVYYQKQHLPQRVKQQVAQYRAAPNRPVVRRKLPNYMNQSYLNQNKTPQTFRGTNGRTYIKGSNGIYYQKNYLPRRTQQRRSIPKYYQGPIISMRR